MSRPVFISLVAPAVFSWKRSKKTEQVALERTVTLLPYHTCAENAIDVACFSTSVHIRMKQERSSGTPLMGLSKRGNTLAPDLDAPQSKRDISAIMRNVHSTNTTPEVIFREALEARGIQCLASATHLPGKPDLILPSKQLAIFIDGDFWHGGQWRKRKLVCLEDQFQNTKTNSR